MTSYINAFGGMGLLLLYVHSFYIKLMQMLLSVMVSV